MFDWYVPLRKFDEATAEDVYGYVTEMGDPSNYIGTTLMNAKGRKSLSNVEILAQIGLMGNRAIRNGGQNTIKQAFARFVRNSGEQNLVKETKVWVEKKGTDMNGNDICDARFSKCCGGVSEEFQYCWEDVSKPYLIAVRDTEGGMKDGGESVPDLTIEENAEKWIRTSPESFCNTSDAKVLSEVLNDYDQETADFYRWHAKHYICTIPHLKRHIEHASRANVHRARLNTRHR